MSLQLINRSPGLKKLRDEGYHIEVLNNFIIIRNVPYVTPAKTVCFGILVSELTLHGNIASRPATHVAYFCGDHPCDEHGVNLKKIVHQSSEKNFGHGIVANHSFSSKPAGGYVDYHHKMTTYFAIISSPAQLLDPLATSKTFPTTKSADADAPFRYVETASSRAGITAAAEKLKIGKVGIVGLGGTGSYILDLIAKTPVDEIHLFDGDKFCQHNAFRSPGAPTLEELKEEPLKVDYFAKIYSKMRRKIIAHPCHVDSSNIKQLRQMEYVFLCIDNGVAKKLIIDALEEFEVCFIDSGMGLCIANDALLGIVRVTTSTSGKRNHVRDNNRISFSNTGADEYSQNIQIADLNALNATIAVIKWKKLLGFYVDLEQEHHCTYTIDGNKLDNEDLP